MNKAELLQEVADIQKYVDINAEDFEQHAYIISERLESIKQRIIEEE